MADATLPFDRRAPLPPPAQPRDWAEAFAALPEEAPPVDAWPALAGRARMAHRARRRRAWRSRLALAATLACAAVGLALWSVRGGMPQGADTADRVPRQAAAVQAGTPADAAASALRTAAAGTASPPSTALRESTDAQARTTRRASAAGANASVAAADTTARAALPGPRRGERPRRPTPPRPSAADALVLPVERRLAGVDMRHESGADSAGETIAETPGGERVSTHAAIGTEPAAVTGTDVVAAGVAVLPPSAAAARAPASASEPGTGSAREDDSLQRLQTRSAQLETWLASLRDTSVGTGPGALLAAEFDDRLTGIDAALAVVPGERVDVQRTLWQARVALLQRALDFESELRALAAEGRDYDGALVAVD